MMKKAREKRKPLKAVAVILVVMFVVTVPMGAFAAKSVKKGVSRIYGANRYETAFAVADALKEQLGAVFFDAVIVAGGLDFSDALSGSYLAVQKKAPILLTDNKNTEDLSAYIEKNLKQNGTVYILGGTNVISAETEAALKEAGNVKRLGGADRYATNLQILSEAGTDGKELLVCTGLGFADSLSAAAVGSPILLVHPKRGFSAQQKALLKAASAAYIIGGETAIPAKIETELKQYTKTERIGGANRYQTSVRLAERFYGTASSVSLAYGQNYPDGLCGGVLAYYMNGPLLLVNNGSHKDAAEYRKSRNISTGCVFGGSGLIGDETAKTVFSINSEIGIWEPEDVLNTENAEKAKAFAEELYRENVDIDPMSAKYTWQLAEESRSWIYFTGLVHDGFLMLDEDKYADEVKEFYTKHIKEDGSIKNYAEGTLDAALPAVNMITLLNSDKLTDTERAQYEKAVNYVYRQLENQVSFPEAGNLMQHAQNAKGEPSPGWQQWRVCLDGVYMSQLFMIRLAEVIDNGTITVINKDGGAVTEEELWNGVYARIDFVMNNMRDSETGLLYHGYSVDEKKTNGCSGQGAWDGSAWC